MAARLAGRNGAPMRTAAATTCRSRQVMRQPRRCGRWGSATSATPTASISCSPGCPCSWSRSRGFSILEMTVMIATLGLLVQARQRACPRAGCPTGWSGRGWDEGRLPQRADGRSSQLARGGGDPRDRLARPPRIGDLSLARLRRAVRRHRRRVNPLRDRADVRRAARPRAPGSGSRTRSATCSGSSVPIITGMIIDWTGSTTMRFVVTAAVVALRRDLVAGRVSPVTSPDLGAPIEMRFRRLTTRPRVFAAVNRDRQSSLWISESFGRHSSPVFSRALTFLLGLRLAMIQRFILKAQRVAAWGRI